LDYNSLCFFLWFSSQGITFKFSNLAISSGGILFIIGVVVGTLVIKSNRRNNSSKIVKRPNIPNEMIENPVKFASSNNVEKQNLVENRNNFGPTNVRNNK
jgi:hypothetical protein